MNGHNGNILKPTNKKFILLDRKICAARCVANQTLALYRGKGYPLALSRMGRGVPLLLLGQAEVSPSPDITRRRQDRERTRTGLGVSPCEKTLKQKHYLPAYYVCGNDRFFYSNTWIGLSIIEQKREWRWLNGDPLDYERFAPGKPDNGPSRLGVRVYPTGSWDDAQCTIQSSFLCSSKGTYNVLH